MLSPSRSRSSLRFSIRFFHHRSLLALILVSFMGIGLALLSLQTASMPAMNLALAAQANPDQQTVVWGPDSRANADLPPAPQLSQHEPSLAISRTDPNVIVAVAKDYRINDNKEVWIYVSQDGGQTWPADLQRQIPGMPLDIPNQSDPVAFARDDGRMYALALGHGNGHGLFITWSDDDGVTWRSPSVPIVYNETPCCLDDKEWPAIDNNPDSPYYHNLYVAWANDGILFSRSTDGGETWSSYTNIAPGYTEYPYPIVGADGTLYVFYMDGWGYCADGYIRYVKSTNGGASFSGPYTVVATSQPCSPIHGNGGYDQWRFFSIITAAADPQNPDNLWVAWTDDNNILYGKTDVLYVRSTDGGQTWTNKARLSHDDPEVYVDHITPVFSMGAEGRLHAFWLDRRDDLSNHLFHGYHTSTIDGVTWEPDTRVSDQPFDLNFYFPPPPGYNAAGDYWGLDTIGPLVMAAWNTTVETSQDIYVSAGFYTEVVTLTGLVYDSLSLQPLPQAQVLVRAGRTLQVDGEGRYTLALLPGTYTVRAQAEGYLSLTQSGIEVLSGTVTLNFPLQGMPVSLSGQVQDVETQGPISGAQVQVEGGPSAVTGPDGLYNLDIAPGIYTVTAQASSYYSQTFTNVEILTDTVLDFSLQRFPVLSGQVRDSLTLQPIPQALVMAIGGPSTETDLNGLFSLPLEVGVYTITAQAEGYYTGVVMGLEVFSDTLLDFELQPEPVTLSGLVRDASSALPIAGAEIRVDGGPFTNTNDSGFYTLSLLPGVYTITAQAEGYSPLAVTNYNLQENAQLDFDLHPLPATLTGKVTDALTGEPLAGAEISLDNGVFAFSSPDGMYLLESPPGVYTASAQAAGYLSETISDLVLLPATTTIQDFALEPLVCPAPDILEVSLSVDRLSVAFSAVISPSLPVDYLWDFGDGVTSTAATPTHLYADYGGYAISLTASNLCGIDEWSQPLLLRRMYFLPLISSLTP
jgi:hypothetical protein